MEREARWLRLAGDRRAPWLVILAVSVGDVLRTVYLSAFTGQPGPIWRVWIYELSSGAVLLALVPFAAWASRRFPWRAFSPAVAIAQALCSALFCAVHVASMVAIRKAVLALVGQGYDFGPLLDGLAYEYGKDLFTYIFFSAMFTMGSFARDEAARRREIRHFRAQGGIRVGTSLGMRFVPFAALSRIEACGNYVTLVTEHGPVLHRATMKEVEALLPPDQFVRTHRSHIVRLSAIAGFRTGRGGEKTVELGNGERVPLSRTYSASRDWLLPPEGAAAPAATPSG